MATYQLLLGKKYLKPALLYYLEELKYQFYNEIQPYFNHKTSFPNEILYRIFICKINKGEVLQSKSENYGSRSSAGP